MRIEKAKGIETSMVNQTKQALEASLKHLLLQKPLDKITISDLTKDCGISRMAFYYHFKDIYDLVEWSCLEDATRALAGKKTYSTWTEGLLQIFEVVYENKPFIMNAYRCISREQIENFLFKLTSDLIMGVVKEQEQAANTTIPDKDKRFIADFYKYSFVGIMLDWIKQGMKEDYGEIARMIAITAAAICLLFCLFIFLRFFLPDIIPHSCAALRGFHLFSQLIRTLIISVCQRLCNKAAEPFSFERFRRCCIHNFLTGRPAFHSHPTPPRASWCAGWGRTADPHRSACPWSAHDKR